MPQKTSRNNRFAKSFGDITLNDFANSVVCKNRIKKSTNNANAAFKKINGEKRFHDFERNSVNGDVEERIISDVNCKMEPRQRKEITLCNKEINELSGKNYPIDIWFILSEYIRPQDVGRFAAICKTSFEVVSTAKFWYSLYKRYYNSIPNMPEQLQPKSLVRKYGLRTSVIRALHYTYPPFASKVKSSIMLEEHPDSLKHRECFSLWQQQQKSQWIFYFKMRKRLDIFLQYPRRDRQPDLLEMLDDVAANLEEHCRVLQVTCQHFIQIPPVIGQILTFVSVTLSHSFQHHKLQLEFASGIQNYSTSHGASSTTIILDPVINFRILDWWHPLYPHNHTIQNLLKQD